MTYCFGTTIDSFDTDDGKYSLTFEDGDAERRLNNIKSNSNANDLNYLQSYKVNNNGLNNKKSNSNANDLNYYKPVNNTLYGNKTTNNNTTNNKINTNPKNDLSGLKNLQSNEQRFELQLKEYQMNKSITDTTTNNINNVFSDAKNNPTINTTIEKVNTTMNNNDYINQFTDEILLQHFKTESEKDYPWLNSLLKELILEFKNIYSIYTAMRNKNLSKLQTNFQYNVFILPLDYYKSSDLKNKDISSNEHLKLTLETQAKLKKLLSKSI
jgi:hypothetical protein